MSTKDKHPLVALRLYFPTGTTAKATRFWHHLSAPALAHHLLKVARKANILQAMLHHVVSGYLPGEKLSHSHPELTDMRHPQCLELLDTEQHLLDFMQEHAEELKKVHAVMFKCEIPLEHQHHASTHRGSKGKLR
ncbi:hypothetical protein NK553_18590 [Pseudomonas sp. ZM23]|jgi:PII-like signaling protein|uniref:DUF190 domain-containing protein n=2 Tax=Pseudomonadota TaxID=1224 RepID=A0AAW7T1E9_BURVI|nr:MULTISPECIES: hypothetical protein [Pseudomonadota]MCP8477262.1 hypothetical protein [Pseudomonas triclosanedens]HEJ6533370.1 hypothetical protein [Pseudomonas aeruginosa]MCP8465963.1 hypothetical protein [Pseudomonas triclosanedens]MDN7796040.1 hypothetical protein [Burkholderia vietnamiensis]WAI47400.1 hypothetical protein OU419_16625 [Pseudomonas triclosanedens]